MMGVHGAIPQFARECEEPICSLALADSLGSADRGRWPVNSVRSRRALPSRASSRREAVCGCSVCRSVRTRTLEQHSGVPGPVPRWTRSSEQGSCSATQEANTRIKARDDSAGFTVIAELRPAHVTSPFRRDESTSVGAVPRFDALRTGEAFPGAIQSEVPLFWHPPRGKRGWWRNTAATSIKFRVRDGVEHACGPTA